MCWETPAGANPNDECECRSVSPEFSVHVEESAELAGWKIRNAERRKNRAIGCNVNYGPVSETSTSARLAPPNPPISPSSMRRAFNGETLCAGGRRFIAKDIEVSFHRPPPLGKHRRR
jgi:hypothetical protein